MSCPSSCASAEGRREFFRQAKRTLAGENENEGEERAEEPEVDTPPEPEFEFDPERIVARVQGRKGWLRDAERQLEQHRWEHPDPVGRSRSERLLLAAGRLEGDWPPSARETRRLSTIGSWPGRAGPAAGGHPGPV